MLTTLSHQDWLSIVPELWVLGTTLVVMLVGLTSQSNRRFEMMTVLAASGLLIAGLSTWMAHPDHAVSTFFGLYTWDATGLLMKRMICWGMGLVLIFCLPYLKRRELAVLEFTLLALLSTVGMMMMASSTHLLTLYLGVELLSLPLYAMVAIDTKQVRAAEAGVKYFIMGAIASAIMLYGMSFIYGVAGELDVAHVMHVTSLSQPTMLGVGWIMVLCGALFKLGVAPFHMWVPDVYDGAPQATTMVIASWPKFAMMAMMVRLFGTDVAHAIHGWVPLIAGVTVLSMMLGNLVALSQNRLMRLWGYSSIAHMGVLVMAWVVPSVISMQTAYFYALAYVLSSMVFVGVVMQLTNDDDHDVVELKDLSGLFATHPVLAMVMLVSLFSMAGVPPMIGFMAKLAVINVLVGIHQILLACAIMVAAVIGIFYYIRVVRVMFFNAVSDTDQQTVIRYRSGAVVTGLLVVNSALLVVYGLIPQHLLGLV